MIDIQSYCMSPKESWESKLISNGNLNWRLIPLKVEITKIQNSEEFANRK